MGQTLSKMPGDWPVPEPGTTLSTTAVIDLNEASTAVKTTEQQQVPPVDTTLQPQPNVRPGQNETPHSPAAKLVKPQTKAEDKEKITTQTSNGRGTSSSSKEVSTLVAVQTIPDKADCGSRSKMPVKKSTQMREVHDELSKKVPKTALDEESVKTGELTGEEVSDQIPWHSGHIC